MANVTESTVLSPELVKDIFSKVKGHSTIVKLSKQQPIAQSGSEFFVFSLDGEAEIIGEGENSNPGEATLTPLVVMPIRVQYQHRLSDEFMRASEEKALKMLEAFSDGFSKKIGRAIDIMSFHGVNPKDLQASGKIGDNHLDTVTSVEYVDGQPEDALTDAVALIGEYDVTGYALSKAMAADLGKYKESGVSQYPEFKMGANPGKLVGTACDVNSTVSKGNDKALAYVGDFENAFKWGYSDQIPMEVIEYGDPDGLGDLKRKHQVLLRGEACVGWGILDKTAFSRIVTQEG